jgi:hypothetical protein
MFSITPKIEQLDLLGNIRHIEDLPSRDPAKLLDLLSKHIDLPTLIPKSFYHAYYASSTNDRTYPLECLLSILLLMQYFKLATAKPMLLLLALSPGVREFCRIPEGETPDESVISKFKIRFVEEIRLFFENLTMPVIEIFNSYDDSLPDNSPDKGKSEMAIYDTSGLKPKVKENNPKTLQSEIKKQSGVKKFLESQGKGENFNVFLAAFKNMPKHANANEAIKLGYANGHFGYFYKWGMLTNGFGVPLHIHFLGKDFYDTLPNNFVSAEEQKYAFDNASLFPVLSEFHKRIGINPFSTFLGDSELDSYDNYGLLNELGYQKVLIPINERNTPIDNTPIPVNSSGIPYCPKDNTQTFISDGRCKGKNRSLRFKYVCPKSRKVDNNWVSDCDDKCRNTNSTVTSYTYPCGDLRTYSGVVRGSDEWMKTYKLRTVVEREISSMKSHPALSHPSTHNCASLRADVYLCAATKLLTVMLAFAVGKPEYMRNLRNLLNTA